MGMRSTLLYQDIEIKDQKKFKKEIKLYSITTNNYLKLPININNNGEMEIDFSEWDDFKLDGYWFKDTIEIMQILSKHVIGEAKFNCDGQYDWKLEFDGKGNVNIERSEYTWGNSEPFIINNEYVY